MAINSLGSKVRLPGFESCLHHCSAVWHQTTYLLSLFLSLLIYQMGIIRAVMPQSCRVNECQLSFSPVDTEETEAQRERKQLAQSHTAGQWQDHNLLTSGLGFFPWQGTNHSSPYCYCLNFPTQYPTSPGRMKIQGYGPKFKIIWNLAFSLRNLCRLIFNTIYTVEINCEVDKTHTLTPERNTTGSYEICKSKLLTTVS